MHLYRMIGKSEENLVERQLAELAAECATIRLQLDDVPDIHFIKESPDGYVKYAQRIDGYCAVHGKYICIRHDLTPKAVVLTTIHEARHVYQCQSANRYKLSVKMRERDAELFCYEFFGTHADGGDAPTMAAKSKHAPVKLFCCDRCRMDGYVLRRAKAMVDEVGIASSMPFCKGRTFRPLYRYRST